MLKHRLVSGALLIAFLTFAAIFMPPPGLLLILLAVVGLGLWEFFRLLEEADIEHFRKTGLVGGLLLILSTWVSLRLPGQMTGVIDWSVLAVIVAIIFLRPFPDKQLRRPLEAVSVTLLGVMYVAFLFSFIVKLLVHDGNVDGKLIVIYLIAVVKVTDIGAFGVGCLIGRHKFFPRISPKKTWEGVIGGILAGLAVSVGWSVWAGGALGPFTLGLQDAVILGICLPVIGIIGDLSESLFKRAAGVKDSAKWIGGIGGVLDVIDSLLFAAPVLYIYSKFVLEAVL